MRISFIHHNADLYGSSRSLLRLSRRLVADGHYVAAILPCAGALQRALQEAGVECRVCESMAVIDRYSIRSAGGIARFIWRCLRTPRDLKNIFESIKPDLVHTNVSLIVGAGTAAYRYGCPHVQHIREFYDDFPWLWKAYRPFLQQRADRIICVSAAVAGQFADQDKVVVLHNGFPVDEFQPPAPDRVEAFRARLGIQGFPLFGVPGRIKMKRKGQETFVDAAARLMPEYPEAAFVVIGAPYPGNEHHEAELRRRVADLGLADRFAFTGEWHDMPAAYAALDVVVMPSGMPEPFGGVVVEAMAMGKPVVGSDVGGTPEQIEDGVTGCLFAAQNAVALAECMAKFCEQPELCAAMGGTGRARFEERFEFERFYLRILQAYEDMIMRKS